MLPYYYGGVIIQGDTASCKHNSFMGFRYDCDVFVIWLVQCRAESS